MNSTKAKVYLELSNSGEILQKKNLFFSVEAGQNQRGASASMKDSLQSPVSEGGWEPTTRKERSASKSSPEAEESGQRRGVMGGGSDLPAMLSRSRVAGNV